MADLRQRRHLFFDLDDTLWDFQKNSAVVLRELFDEFNLESKLNAGFDDFLKTYREINHSFWLLYYRKLMDKQHLRNERFHKTFLHFGYNNYNENLVITEQYLERAPQRKELVEDCLEVLEYLKRNYQLHIITNGFKEVQNIKLNGSGLKPYFKNIIISEEHKLVKPEEKIFRLAEQLASASHKDCVMIGDSLESDIEGALNAGWEAIHFNPTGKTSLSGAKNISGLGELKLLF